jgi:hypothetical protein
MEAQRVSVVIADDQHLFAEALEAILATGYVTKDQIAGDLVRAILDVAGG